MKVSHNGIQTGNPSGPDVTGDHLLLRLINNLKTRPPLQHHLVSLHAHQLSSGHGLHHGEDLRQTGVPHVLQLTQETCFEEHLPENKTPPQNLIDPLINNQSTCSLVAGVCVSTFECPNLYCVWSISSEPSSFSTAFLLSTKESSGMALGFKMR